MAQTQPYIETTGIYPYSIRRTDWVVNNINFTFCLLHTPDPRYTAAILNGFRIPCSISDNSVLYGIVPRVIDGNMDEVTVIYWGT